MKKLASLRKGSTQRLDADEAAEPAARRHFVHVFVDRARPDRATPIPDSLRQALQALCDERSKL